MRRLLIVDDETPVQHALRRLLNRHFGSQQLGVETRADPRLDGVTRLASAWELHPRTLRMMLNAAADCGTVPAAVNRAGLHRYIPKPWDELERLADLRAALLRSPAHRRLVAADLPCWR